MNAGFLKKFLICLGALTLSSCGDTSPGNSVSLFKTVQVTATASPSPYVSQVLPGNVCTNGAVTGGVITNG